MDEKRNKYLIKNYGITCAEDEAMGDACMVCGKIPTPEEKRLHVDHCHQWKYVKLTKIKYANCWQVWGEYWGITYACASRFRNKAIKNVREQLRRASVRGKLCYPCNVLIRRAFNDPQRLLKASQYLTRHQSSVFTR